MSEIERNVTLATAGMDAMGSDADPQTAVMDAIANLLIFAHENDLDVAGAVVDGVAHYCATYMEPMDADEAEGWLHDALFPFSGDHDIEHYIGRQAITFAGHAGKFGPPEFGV